MPADLHGDDGPRLSSMPALKKVNESICYVSASKADGTFMSSSSLRALSVSPAANRSTHSLRTWRDIQ